MRVHVDPLRWYSAIREVPPSASSPWTTTTWPADAGTFADVRGPSPASRSSRLGAAWATCEGGVDGVALDGVVPAVGVVVGRGPAGPPPGRRRRRAPNAP
ncbi:hypothetical protein GCM10025868_17520 [Angustibacter aerolatus]|uniref:Uncharacterized protein n=1 Tax=Angustibacter aerolatus TaxID=1162965 RepID=A0ABQ6JE77_9ACTN|nr:hypothetical protein GCM10025868_17520 [Angustibacter aerolatus]